MLKAQQRALEERKKEELRQKHKANSQGEPEVVPGALLAQVLQNWCKRWLREWGINPGTARSMIQQSGAVGPVQYLSQESGIHIRRVSGLCNGEFDFVGLSQAEQILMAIDQENLLRTGEIPVVPSPNWPFDKWVSYMEQQRGCI